MSQPEIWTADQVKRLLMRLLRLKKKLEATTLMVTHDSLSASYCDRVILMRDGIVCSELVNKGNRRVFFNELMEVLRKLNGGE